MGPRLSIKIAFPCVGISILNGENVSSVYRELLYWCDGYLYCVGPLDPVLQTSVALIELQELSKLSYSSYKSMAPYTLFVLAFIL